MSEHLEKLQATMLDLVLDEDVAGFERDPAAFVAERGLGEADQKAFTFYRRRLLTYRALVRFALTDPVPDCFPICQALLDAARQWRPCLDAFLDSRSVRSPYYRHIHPHFVEWLAESGWGQERWPFLLQLAHFEYLEIEVLRHPDEGPYADLLTEPEAGRHAVFHGTARNLAYAYRVHEATVESPVPEAAPALLFCYRDGDGDFCQREVGGPESAFLSRCQQGEPIAEAAGAAGLDLADAQELLEDLRAQGAVLGYR